MWCFLLLLVPATDAARKFCKPADSCWPSEAQVRSFSAKIDGEVMLPANPQYKNYTDTQMMANLRFKDVKPAIIVFAKNEYDVVSAVQFVKEHNIRMTILSSGHSYVGRSTAATSLQINLSKMQSIQINSNDSASPTGVSAEIQSGTPWATSYEAVDRAGFVVVGGSAHTVSAGGYTQGGGHSPMTRALGLGVDQVLAMTVVTVDGLVRRITQTGQEVKNTTSGVITTNTDNDLFYALRGGGGSTYGIVISYKYKLHKPPSGFVHVSGVYPYVIGTGPNVGERVSKAMDDFMKTMHSPGWGGYVIYSQYNDPNLAKYGVTGTITVTMLHYGAWDANVAKDIERLDGVEKTYRIAQYSSLTNYTTFWEYEKGVNDPRGYYAYIFNTFQQEKHLDGRLGAFAHKRMSEKRVFGCTAVLLGGAMTKYSDNSSAVHENFRNARTSVSCGIPMLPYAFDYQISAAQDLAKDVSGLGSGMYFNEPDSERASWKEDFWGSKYDGLLEIKKKYDPNKWLTCHHCVGYEEGDV